MEPSEEVKAKIKKFLEEYKDLVLRHGIDFAAYPVFVPDETGRFSVVIQTQPVETKKKDEKLVA